MKIWKKFVLFTIAIISIVLSFSRYFIVKNNFLHSMKNISRQNTNQHSIEKYMLESNIVKGIQDGEEITDEKIIEYLNSLYTYTENDTELFAVYTEDYQKIYSTINDIDEIDINEILYQDINTYCFRKIKDNHYMLFTSHWNINNKIIYIVNAYDVSSIYKEKDRQLSEILITDVIILVVSIIVIFAFSIYLTNPIYRLNKMSKEIASGKFNERVDIKSKDEIGELAKSFNLMAEQIEKKINELNLQVKQKNDFINGFTHEIKTPMTAIMGYADLLRLKNVMKKYQKKV